MHSFLLANLIHKLNKAFSRIETNCWERVPIFKNPLSLDNKNSVRNNWEANGFLGIVKDKKQLFSKASRHRNIQTKKGTEVCTGENQNRDNVLGAIHEGCHMLQLHSKS